MKVRYEDVLGLSPQAQTLFRYLYNLGSISAREAYLDLDMTSATLSSRICDLEKKGFRIHREAKRHPLTGKRYTRYILDKKNLNLFQRVNQEQRQQELAL